VQGEGFFIAAFRKQESSAVGVTHLPKAKTTPAEKNAAQLLQPWLREEMAFLPEKEDWLAMPATVAAHLPLLKKHLYLRKAGINMGRLIREQLVPNHELAMAAAISNAIAGIEVSEAQALQYLRRQEIVGIEPPSNGWLLVKYKGLALGWIKAIGHRMNNYYPTEWRILK
jgi:NOL1/NOP2/fmu family ribosome biogenesis protein